MLEKIENLINEIKSYTIDNLDDLETFRLKYLSKKGVINNLFSEFRNVPNDQKKAFGVKINELKNLANQKYNSIQDELSAKSTISGDIDYSLPSYPFSPGSRHPVSILR